nr:hypothetical protein BaRGS_027721 [Batillaria attramentaria]
MWDQSADSVEEAPASEDNSSKVPKKKKRKHREIDDADSDIVDQNSDRSSRPKEKKLEKFSESGYELKSDDSSKQKKHHSRKRQSMQEDLSSDCHTNTNTEDKSTGHLKNKEQTIPADVCGKVPGFSSGDSEKVCTDTVKPGKDFLNLSSHEFIQAECENSLNGSNATESIAEKGSSIKRKRKRKRSKRRESAAETTPNVKSQVTEWTPPVAPPELRLPKWQQPKSKKTVFSSSDGEEAMSADETVQNGGDSTLPIGSANGTGADDRNNHQTVIEGDDEGHHVTAGAEDSWNQMGNGWGRNQTFTRNSEGRSVKQQPVSAPAQVNITADMPHTLQNQQPVHFNLAEFLRMSPEERGVTLPPFMKSERLPNGAMMYTRVPPPKGYQNAEQSRPHYSSSPRGLSKQEQLATVATNKSIIITNSKSKSEHGIPQPSTFATSSDKGGPSEPSTAACESSQTHILAVPLYTDYSRFPDLTSAPKVGDLIAYKVLELGDDYTPGESDYKVGSYPERVCYGPNGEAVATQPSFTHFDCDFGACFPCADKFKAIFDLCDEDKDGYIDVDHFKGLAKDHFGAEGEEEITGVINLLDPEGRGQISFDDFSRGVEQIIEIQQQAQSRIKSSVSEDTLVPLDIAGDLTSLQQDKVSPLSQSTFVEYDFDSPSEDLVGLNADTSAFGNESVLAQHLNGSGLQPPASEDEGDSALSGRSSEINENSRQEVTDEENYEDYGEVESEADVSDQGLPNRRLLTTAALASQLQRSSRDVTPNSTRRSSFGSDEIFDDIDGNFQDLNGRVRYLESQLLRLTDSQVETTNKQTRLKEENGVLVQKVIYLEEQLRDMELRGEERVKEERRKQQDLMARRDREKSEELDYVASRLHRIEGEYETVKEEASKLRHEINKLRAEKIELQERMLEKQEMYNMLYDDHERLKAEYHKQEDLHQRERRSMGQLLDELGKELEDLRRYKIEVETGVRSPSGNISELPGRYMDLQQEIHKLKEEMWKEWRGLLQENRVLQGSNEDLNAQLMNRCVQEGKSLLQEEGNKSLAEELEHLTKEELLQKLQDEQEFNLRLKQYVDRIIITILEKNPSLLEIKGF